MIDIQDQTISSKVGSSMYPKQILMRCAYTFFKYSEQILMKDGYIYAESNCVFMYEIYCHKLQSK